MTGTDTAEATPRWQTLVAALAFIAIFAVFRLDAVRRIQAIFIADSAEYMMMAQGMISGNAVPVSPVRSNFFSLFLVVPLFLREQLAGQAAPYDSSIARVVPLAFHLLACLGAWRLGRMAAGVGAGFLAAVVVAVLPEFGYWSTDYLTDGPAAAFIVWGLVFWLEGRAAPAGIVLGLAVLMRYQSLITLGAFLALPLIARRPRELGKLVLGGLGPVALLGTLDWFAWGTPFASLWNFAHKQSTSFEGVGDAPAVVSANAAFNERWYYFTHSFEIFTAPLVVAFLLLLFARWRFRNRRVADVGAWVVLFTVVVLSAQRYKESRYLLAVMPMVAALGAASVVAIGGAIAGRIPFLRSGPASLLREAALVLMAGFFALHCWELQAKRDYGKFGSVVRAADSIPEEALPALIGTWQPWLLVPQHPVLAFTARTWRTREFTLLNTGGDLARFARMPAEQVNFKAITGLVESMDYVLATEVAWIPSNTMWALLNRQFVVEDAFWERSNPRRPIFRLRRASDAAEGSFAFWSSGPKPPEPVDALVRFDSRLALLELSAIKMPSAPAVLRVDMTWLLELDRPQSFLAHAIYGQRTPSGRRVVGMDRFRVLVPEPDGQNETGSTLRIHRYVSAPYRTPGVDLRLALRIVALDEQSKPTGGELRPQSAPPELLVDGSLELVLRLGSDD